MRKSLWSPEFIRRECWNPKPRFGLRYRYDWHQPSAWRSMAFMEAARVGTPLPPITMASIKRGWR